MTAEDRGLYRQGALLLLPACLFVAFLFLAPLLVDHALLQKWWWGGLHLWKFPLVPLTVQVLGPFLPLMVMLLPEEHFQILRARLVAIGSVLARWLSHPAAAAVAAILFLWTFRSMHLIFGDAFFYTTDLMPKQAFSTRGFLIMFDSVGATLLYSMGFRFAKLYLNIDIVTWYNLAGIATTMLFLAWAFANRGKGRLFALPISLALLFLGNWSQATFGAPEHYGQLLLAILAFAILSDEALRGREPLWKPCLAYSLGAFFHSGIGWLLPALLFVIWKCWRAEDRTGRQFALMAMLIPALMTGALIYHLGFDISFFSQSNAAMGKLIPMLSPDHPYSGQFYHYSTFDPRHLAHILQQIFLMGWPGIILLAAAGPRIEWRQFLANPRGGVLLVGFACMLAFCLLWNPDLEFWRDQDLFSGIGLMVCLLGIYGVLGPAGERLTAPQRDRILLAAIVGGLAWRVPVILYHSVLAMNYANPLNFGAYWPFALN